MSDEYKDVVSASINNWLDVKQLRTQWNDFVSGKNLKNRRSKTKQAKFNNIQLFLK